MSLLRFGHSQANPDSDKSYFLTADFFLSFASPEALMILDSIHKKEMTCLAISRNLGMTPKTVLARLKAMEREGILVSRVGSKDVLYRVANSNIAKAFERILELPERKLKKTGSPKNRQSIRGRTYTGSTAACGQES